MLIPRTTGSQSRRGTVLLAVIVVIVLLFLAAYQYSDMVTSEYVASDNFHKAAQARMFADSGVHYAAALLSNPDNLEGMLNNNPYDNAEAFKDVPVPVDEKRNLRGRFTLIAPANPDDGGSGSIRFGVTDEGGKINLNAWMKRDPTGDSLLEILKKLPNMTEGLAAAIVDWLDADNEPRQGGAEGDHYSGRNPSYSAKNGPIDSLEELLLVEGVTPELLFGSDLNRNGVRDPEEGDGDLGWAAYLTLYSREINADAYGNLLTNLNDSKDLQQTYPDLAEKLGDDLAKFVIMYRQYGPSTESGIRQSFGLSIFSLFAKPKMPTAQKVVTGNLASWEPDFKRMPVKTLRSLFELVDTQVTIRGKKQGEPSTIYFSPLKDVGRRRDLLPKLFDSTSVFPDPELPSRINVNTAPRAVLEALPELTPADVEAIVSARPRYSSGDGQQEIFRTPAWLSTEANLKTDLLRKVESMITTRSQVYRVQVVGSFADNQGPSARVEAVIDTNGGRPRILAWRDLSELGRWVNVNR